MYLYTIQYFSVHQRNVTGNAQGNFNRQKINIYEGIYVWKLWFMPSQKKMRHSPRAFRVPRWVEKWGNTRENRGMGHG